MSKFRVSCIWGTLIKNFLNALFIALAMSAPLSAQLNQKPSPLREPKGSRPDKPASEIFSLPQIKTRADFDLLQRTYYAGTRYAIPHILFVIDRSAQHKVYFVNAQKFRFHKDFLYAEGLAPAGAKLDKQLYFDHERRFVIGTVAWQPSVSLWTWELWEGDLLPKDMIGEAHTALTQAFFEKLNYKPNSSRQEIAARELALPSITQADLAGKQTYLALNTGHAVGRVRIVTSEAELEDCEPYDIVVLNFLPLKISPVRGIIVTMPSTPLSHINILSHGWKIPNIYVKHAELTFAPLAGQWIDLKAEDRKYTWQPARPAFTPPQEKPAVAPAADIERSEILPLAELTRMHSVAYGAKAANLGEVQQKLGSAVNIPDGFTIPFHFFASHMNHHGFDKELAALIANPAFRQHKAVRKKQLAELRKKITQKEIDKSLAEQIRLLWQKQLKSRGVFVRSSSNLEDVQDFSGAGLNYSAANQRSLRDILSAVKQVWASLYSFEAYEARRHFGVDQQHIYMAVIIQTGIDMERGGVLITRNPYQKKTENDAVLISSVCGHNSRVADNRGMPEQVLVNYESDAVIVWTRASQQDALRFNVKGELSATAADCVDESGRVLDDKTARNLARLALKIRAIFDDKIEQDIEWGILGDRIYILQSRPYRD